MGCWTQEGEDERGHTWTRTSWGQVGVGRPGVGAELVDSETPVVQPRGLLGTGCTPEFGILGHRQQKEAG